MAPVVQTTIIRFLQQYSGAGGASGAASFSSLINNRITVRYTNLLACQSLHTAYTPVSCLQVLRHVLLGGTQSHGADVSRPVRTALRDVSTCVIDSEHP